MVMNESQTRIRQRGADFVWCSSHNDVSWYSVKHTESGFRDKKTYILIKAHSLTEKEGGTN